MLDEDGFPVRRNVPQPINARPTKANLRIYPSRYKVVEESPLLLAQQLYLSELGFDEATDVYVLHLQEANYLVLVALRRDY